MEMIIHCTEKGCLGNEQNLKGRLVIIGQGLHCPYCRGYTFTLKPSAEVMAKWKEMLKKRKEEALKKRQQY